MSFSFFTYNGSLRRRKRKLFELSHKLNKVSKLIDSGWQKLKTVLTVMAYGGEQWKRFFDIV